MVRQNHDLKGTLKTDVLVIGSGLAGLLATLKLLESKASVVLVCKGGLADSNSALAQGGLAASSDTNAFDSCQLHLADTIKSGAGLVDEKAAQAIIFDGNKLIKELTRLGVEFDCNSNGALSLAREGGHCQPRVLHKSDTTGNAVISPLLRKLKEYGNETDNIKGLTILENTSAVSLLKKDGACVGAQLSGNHGQFSVFADHTILATGGLGRIYARTTNPMIATGDGIALAYRAGASLVDMEFVQFHPTTLALKGAPPFLISEAVRGAGAVLLDAYGKPFMSRFSSDGELATRDIVARAIHTIMQEQSQPTVFLDLRPIGAKALSSTFPNILNVVRQYGIDPQLQPIPISPAAHYFMGGIMTNIQGNTSVAQLCAIGECASTGLHGANRLASNSLLEAGVMALRVADSLTVAIHLLVNLLL